MPNKENLIPAKKGEVRNKKGYPKGQLNFKTVIKMYCESTPGKNPFTGKYENINEIQRAIIQLLYIMENSNNDNAKISAIKEILERVEGKVTQPMDIGVTVEQRASRINALFPTEDELKLLNEENNK
jgi:hypothetical protein